MAGAYYFRDPPNYSAGICSKKECKENIKNRYYALRRIKMCKKLLKLLPEGNPLLFRQRNGQSQILDGQIVIPLDGMKRSRNDWYRDEFLITENTQPIELGDLYKIRKWKEDGGGNQPPRFKSLHNNQFVAIYSQFSIDQWRVSTRRGLGEWSAVFCKKCSKKLIRELKAAKKNSKPTIPDVKEEPTSEGKSIKQLVQELMENAPSDEEAISTDEEEQIYVIEHQEDGSAPDGQEMIQEVETSPALNSKDANTMEQSSLIEENDRKPSAADIIQPNAAPVVQNINITNIHNTTLNDSVVTGDINSKVGDNESN